MRLQAALAYAVNHGADIVNASFRLQAHEVDQNAFECGQALSSETTPDLCCGDAAPFGCVLVRAVAR